MRSKKAIGLIATTVAVALGATACGSSGGSSSAGGSGASVKKDAALTSIVNPSTKKGGTATYEQFPEPDSLDPGNTYYGWIQQMSLLWGRSLLMFKPAPGSANLQVVPDLATGLGQSSDDAKTWTYHLKSGLKFQDGSPITSKDVKYAIERSNFAPSVLSGGPTYFRAYLAGGDKYKGPYEDKNPNGLASIETPNDTTITFHLNQPFADFDYLATFSQTDPVQQSKDTGASYVQHIQSTGPYKFSSYTEGQGATLVRNPMWDPKTDPNRPALPDKIVLKFNVNQVTVDNNLINDSITADSAGRGVAPQTQPKVLTNPKLLKQSDNPSAGATEFIALNTHVAPFNNAECRKAVQWGLDKQSLLNAAGGPPTGDVATTLLPPTVSGYTKFNMYPSAGNKGDVAKAKAALTACGMPNGFTTNLTARSDNPAEMAMATAAQASLKQIGITANIKSYPGGKYFTNFAGNPSYANKNDLGMMFMAWGADWPDGYGFMDQLVDGTAIKPSGGDNLAQLNDPAINKALAAAIANTDAAARTKAWGDIDKMVAQTAVIVPVSYKKNLMIRPASATNVTVSQAYLGIYNYLLMGTSK